MHDWCPFADLAGETAGEAGELIGEAAHQDLPHSHDFVPVSGSFAHLVTTDVNMQSTVSGIMTTVARFLDCFEEAFPPHHIHMVAESAGMRDHLKTAVPKGSIGFAVDSAFTEFIGKVRSRAFGESDVYSSSSFDLDFNAEGQFGIGSFPIMTVAEDGIRLSRVRDEHSNFPFWPSWPVIGWFGSQCSVFKVLIVVT